MNPDKDPKPPRQVENDTTSTECSSSDPEFDLLIPYEQQVSILADFHAAGLAAIPQVVVQGSPRVRAIESNFERIVEDEKTEDPAVGEEVDMSEQGENIWDEDTEDEVEDGVETGEENKLSCTERQRITARHIAVLVLPDSIFGNFLEREQEAQRQKDLSYFLPPPPPKLSPEQVQQFVGKLLPPNLPDRILAETTAELAAIAHQYAYGNEQSINAATDVIQVAMQRAAQHYRHLAEMQRAREMGLYANIQEPRAETPEVAHCSIQKAESYVTSQCGQSAAHKIAQNVLERVTEFEPQAGPSQPAILSPRKSLAIIIKKASPRVASEQQRQESSAAPETSIIEQGEPAPVIAAATSQPEAAIMEPQLNSNGIGRKKRKKVDTLKKN